MFRENHHFEVRGYEPPVVVDRYSVIMSDVFMRYLKAISILLVLLASFSLISWSKTSLRTVENINKQLFLELPPLYLPEAKYVRLITLGFNNVVSDILWFNTLSYFGKQFHAGKDYKWLSNMCDLVTTLNPRASHSIEFCATMLSWSAKDPEKSNLILARAINDHPQIWRYRYLRAFNYWYFLENRQLARQDLLAAAKLPNAPAFLASMASRLVATDQDPHLAVEFLKEIISKSNDENAKKTLAEKLNMATITLNISSLNIAIEYFEKQKGYRPKHLDELVQNGIVTFIPKDAWGGTFYLDETTGEIKTTSGKKGLAFGGKTAKTGIAASNKE